MFRNGVLKQYLMETSQKDLCAKNTTPKEPQGGSKAIPKEIYSTRLGVKYEVMIKKYNEFRGKKNPYLKSVMEPTTTYSKTGVRVERLYYKEYKNLEFDIIRSHQQIRWNHLTKSTFKHERHGETNNYMIVFNDICEKCSKVCNSIHFQRNFESWTSGNVILYLPGMVTTPLNPTAAMPIILVNTASFIRRENKSEIRISIFFYIMANLHLLNVVMVVLRMRLYTTSAVFADLLIKGFVGTK
ncbi:hypothetical protein GLOIN_2v1867102 [Rhizophagus irregularis DAOM 181602=DAOM 197198]|uniref:Uncharacterized protein n=1 Tax=Rhizophagus irregularis (strain DAOM 181602 / DAOM 197198 / MUCL 43194) TaxID=747089 RepID=A0A2P4QYS9_RHIID|nr:hypothetical protein GLOIN_2v1867102 [Rhizophagus irregularis DAOM 181602=DAOM 197198]POG82755.1 hypothetical protein GLOIN_2v1867102 [Rhizophagus irregularis DAOM 181602=DAOM 197198]|eukprot:XP_025189621.1 hypothetical protein GLOIN_2v1867102 [Rhizophagus irregularis DAOM 181602=DAOM 197198]